MLIGLSDLANEFIENRDKSNITKHLYPFLFSSKGDNLHFFYKFDKFLIDFCACFK